MKNRRSLLVNWTRPRTLRCSTITWCLRAAFSASSRLLGLKGEATRLKTKNISATIVADDKRFYHRIKRTTFSAHTAINSVSSWWTRAIASPGPGIAGAQRAATPALIALAAGALVVDQ